MAIRAPNESHSTESSHRAEFTWQENPSCEFMILDGGEEVAALYPGTPTMPTNSHAALRPISLHRLRPAPGAPMIIADGEVCGPLCLSWRKHLIFNMEIEDIEVSGSGSERLVLRVQSHDTGFRQDQPGASEYRPDNVQEDTVVEIFYDANQNCYVYDLTTILHVQPGREEFVIAHDKRGIEFGDILPNGANDNYPPIGSKRYSNIVYEAPDSHVYYRPQNKHFGPDKLGVFYAPNGFVAYVAEDGANPRIEFIDGSGARVKSELCWAMYDLHFKCREDWSRHQIRSGLPIVIRYRLSSLSRGSAHALMDQARPDPVLDHPMVRCPAFTPNTPQTFHPSDEYRSPSDKWFWICTDSHCRWDWEIGDDSPGSLMLSRDDAVSEVEFSEAPWIESFDFCSNDGRASLWLYNRLVGEHAYCVRARVRTESVVGRAFVAMEYVDNDSNGIDLSSRLFISDLELSGTNDWTDIQLATQKPEFHSPWTGLFLVLEGTGRCWFDDIVISTQ